MAISQAWGFVFTGIFGTLLHFLFDWTGGSIIAALFSAVNESIWEHMKLLFYPAVVYALLQYRRNPRPGFWYGKLLGIVTGLALIPALFYTYTGALGIFADWFNITIFFLSAGVVYYLEYRLFRKDFAAKLPQWPAWCALILLSLIFTFFTFFPPHVPLFRDPLTGSYGFYG